MAAAKPARPAPMMTTLVWVGFGGEREREMEKDDLGLNKWRRRWEWMEEESIDVATATLIAEFPISLGVLLVWWRLPWLVMMVSLSISSFGCYSINATWRFVFGFGFGFFFSFLVLKKIKLALLCVNLLTPLL